MKLTNKELQNAIDITCYQLTNELDEDVREILVQHLEYLTDAQKQRASGWSLDEEVSSETLEENPWISWDCQNGSERGPNNLSSSTLVEVMLVGGLTSKGPVSKWNWGYDEGVLSVVAYRVVKDET